MKAKQVLAVMRHAQEAHEANPDTDKVALVQSYGDHVNLTFPIGIVTNLEILEGDLIKIDTREEDDDAETVIDCSKVTMMGWYWGKKVKPPTEEILQGVQEAASDDENENGVAGGSYL